MYEQAFFNLLNVVQRSAGETAVCIAGGCPMNSVANGKIFERTNFRDLYVQAAAGDAGGAMGAAYIVWNEVLGEPRGDVMEHAYLGPSFSNESAAAEIETQLDECRVAGCTIQFIPDEGDTARIVRGGPGLVASTGAIPTLAAQIRALRRDPARLARMGTAARRAYEACPKDASLEAWIRCLRAAARAGVARQLPQPVAAE
jgi:hypothetical protein